MEVLGVTKSVAQYLREHIITGELAPGQKLNEIELASRLGISRPPLREAFRLLENEHLIVSIPRKGCYVTELSAGDCRQVFQAREMIECYVIDLLKAKKIRELPNVDSAVASTLRIALSSQESQKEALRHQNPFPYFHIRLVEQTDNHWLIRFYHSIASSLARYQYMCTYIPGVAEMTHKEHEQILELIKAGHYKEAKKLLTDHIRYFFRYVEEIINKKYGHKA